MTKPRWELCRSTAGFWVRFRSSNGNIIVSSETYKRKRDALRAIGLVTGDQVVKWGDEMTVNMIGDGNGWQVAVEVRDLTAEVTP